MPWQLILDITIAILLVAFIVYAVALSRQLKELRKSRDDMEKIIKTFNEATARAEAGIPRLRKTAEDAGQALDETVAKARTLRDDLAYMVERADGMASRLEGAVRVARGEVKPAPKEGRGVEGKGVETRGLEAKSGAVKGVEAWAEEASAQDARLADARLAAARPRPRARASETVDRGPAAPGGGDGGRGPLGGTRPLGGLDAARPDSGVEADDFTVDDERSEAERELLRALQSAR